MNLRKLKRRLQRITPGGRQMVIGIPFLWLFLFFMLPFFIVLKISFAEADVAIPPYTEIYSYVDQKIQVLLNLGNYAMLGDDELYIAAYLGGHSVFYVELPSGKLVQSFVANAERRGARPTWDDEVYVWWEDDSGVVLRS